MRAASTHEKGHGRVEGRTRTTSTWVNEYLAEWPGVAQVFGLERTRGGGTTEGNGSQVAQLIWSGRAVSATLAA